jgi:hypothetical protein
MSDQTKRTLALAGALVALALLIALAGASVAALETTAILTVCPPPGAGCDYTTIQAAIDNANAGDTIRVAQGTYTENLTVTVPITVEGGYSGPPDWTRDPALYETIVRNDQVTTPTDWDGQIVAKPAVIRDGAGFRMWYDGHNLYGDTAIGLATSSDGLTWTKSVSNPVLAGTPGDWDGGSGEHSAYVIEEGGIYKMWYEGSADYDLRQTGYATSTDGIDWTKYPGNPVIHAGPEGYDQQAAAHGSVLHEGGVYKRWYHAIGDQGVIIAYATAPDEVTWTKQGPVLFPQPGGWDAAALWGPTVLNLDGTYWMWYAASGPAGPPAIGVVTSTNGISWTRFLTGPVVTETAAIGDPMVISDSGELKMWYSNYDAGTIDYAESDDGIHWTLYLTNPVLAPGTLANWGQPAVRFEGASSGSVLDGLTLTGGSGDVGGGVQADDQDITLRHCLVRDNYAYGGPGSMGAGGVVDFHGELTILDSRIVDNQANQGAAGIRVHDGVLVMTNTLVADNHGAGGVHLNGAGRMVNATIANNDGGVLLNTDAGGTLVITNSIIFGNGWSVAAEGNAVAQVAYSDVEDGWPGEGNLGINPRFVDPAGGDYHLQAWSPCIDAGTADGAPDHDLDGVARPQNAGYDMGVYEFAGTPIPPLFTDVASDLGLDISSGEFGAAWGDLDGDGWLDLAIGDGSLFTSSLGTTFSDATAAAGLEPIDYLGGVAWGDSDNDGDLDLLSSWRKVYRQNSLPFTSVWDGSGDRPSLAWVDYDRDGDLDVYASGRLYRYDGGDVFTDVSGSAGLGDQDWAMASTWADYDDDGDPDLYLTCDGCENRLYRNNGEGTFSDVTGSAGVGDGGSGHGAAWGDYDNDGDWDLFVANNDNQYNVLYHNEGGGTFTDVSNTAGLHDRLGFATGANWLDYDLDGWLDVFVVNRDEENALYHNNGDGTFTEVGAMAGVADGRDSDGSTVGDYDNDGDPDIYVVSGIWDTGSPNLLFRNNTDPGPSGPHWLKVKLAGVLSNHSAIGARVRIYAGGTMQTRQLAGSGGYMSQDALEALFGLGSYNGSVTVEVTWPSGVVDTVTGVAVDQTLTISESTPHLHDVGVVNVAPDGEVLLNTTLAVRATLRNLGNQVESGVPISCTIETGGVPVYAKSVTSGDVAPGAWEMLAFPDYTPAALGIYTLTCQSGLPGDEEPANDATSSTLTVVPKAPDAWTKDNPDDDGDVPSGYDNWYTSPDIWVRHNPDGGPIHQEPIEGVSNTVYVRLRNRGEFSVTGTLDVYWIESSLGVRCGDWAHIGTVNFSNLLPGEVRIVSTDWVPIRSGHTCLQSVINADGDPFDAGLECAPQWVPYDNNVSWRNVEIYANPATGRGSRDVQQAEVRLVNVYDRPQSVDLVIERRTFPLNGTITLSLPEALFDRWLAYGAGWGTGLEVLTPTKEIRISAPVSATIGAIPMQAAEAVSVGLQFEGEAGLAFELALRERIDGWTVGGVAYQWVIPDTAPPAVSLTSPADGAGDVALDAPLVVQFDEEVLPLTLQLELDPDPGGWLLAWNEAGTVVTATHAGLNAATTYVATVTASDAWGNAMAAPASWSFTTASTMHQIYLPLVVRGTP